MGRYYSGDINGKFWFGTQPSNDADFFGSEGTEPSYLEYYFDTDHLDNIKAGIKDCKKQLGDNKKKLDEFFKKENGYNDDMLIEAGIDPSSVEWYARLELGEKILACVKENGECNFEAEL